MDSQVTWATIVNLALTELGLPANFSLDDDTDQADTVNNVLPLVADHCFGLHDWTWSRRTLKLVRLEATPETGYQYAFKLPGDRIGAPLKLLADPRHDAPLRNYTIEGDEVHCDQAEAWARCRVRLAPQYWDPAFRPAFVKALAGALAVPLQQDTDLAGELSTRAFGTPSQLGAGGMFGRLIAQDLAAAPIGAPFAGYCPLVNARDG
jgi:hypothetical protein